MNYCLSAIYVYPVKSLAGFSVEDWQVNETGLQFDRKWMIVDSAGRFLSQRNLPRMALVKTRIQESDLILSAASKPDLRIGLTDTGSELISCTIWNDQCSARSVSVEADAWLSEFLQQPCRLVYQPDEQIRAVDPRFANAGDRTAFSDGFPFLVVSENSLAALNQAMSLNLPMQRFRPNLVVSGCAAYAEDSWREIRIGSIEFRLPKPCSRCAVPTIDPETAEIGKEPLATLNRLRKWQNKVYFGQNALHDQVGRLAVGDQITVKSTGPNQPPL